MVTNPGQGATVEDTVLEVIQLGQLTQWREQLIFGKSIRRFEHFSMINDRDYRSLGMPPEEIKKLRNTVHQVQRKLLTTHAESTMVYVSNTNTGAAPPPNSHSTMINKDQIKLMEMLGEGTFAVVKRAIWCRDDGRKVDVAVKILRDMSPLVMEDLKVEAGHLLKLKHPNLIQMHGVVLQPPMMVFEMCEGGALLDRLRDDKRPVPLLTTLLDYCLQIVKAMSYLEKEHCVHRDLAARNILLTSDEKTVKICDFGLMRNLKENEEMYIMGPQKRVPFSWCPPEALKHRKFSHASDVWAFGVTVWEIFSLGEEPWIGCRAIEVLKRLETGERLEKPTNCSAQIYDIVTLCWKVNPEHRPKFTQLKGYLQEAQFNLAEVRESQAASDKNLGMTSGDRLIVVNNVGFTWYGQNMRTTKFGSFLRSSVFVLGTASTKPVPAATVPPPAAVAVMSPSRVTPTAVETGNSRISRPIQGSFIHTGHADPRGGSSWGRPEAIDNIYLKNPVLGVPLEPGIPLTLPSESVVRAITPTRVAPPPPTTKHDSGKPSSLNVRTNLDPLRADWGDFDAAQTPSFSPSKIELAPVPLSLLHGLGPSSSAVTSPPAPAIPFHHRIPPPTSYSNHSHNVIFPSGTTAGVLPIPHRPNPPRVSSQTTAAAAVKVPAPTTSYNPPSNVLGNGVTRPPVATQAIPRPSSDHKAKDIPIIRPLDYKNSFNGGSRPAPTAAPMPSTSTTKPKENPVNKNLINELNIKLQPSGGGPTYRPLHTGAPLNSSASDPFVVSAAVKEAAEAKRYNEMREQVTIRPQQQAAMLQPSVNMVRPHSTIGTNAVPCLVPTPAPQQPKAPAPQVSAAQNPPITRPPQAPQLQPVVAHPTPPAPPSTIISSKPLTVVIPEKREARPAAAVQPQPSQSRPKAPEVSSQAPSRPVQPPKGIPPAGASGVTPAGTLPRGRDSVSESDRQSRIEEEIASALPKPSRLFYGAGDETSVALRPSTSSAASAPPRPHSVTGVPFPSVQTIPPSVPKPTPVKPVDPLPISLHNVLQPIKLHAPALAPALPPPPATVSAPARERNIDVASIMNAYHRVPVYANPLNPPPGYYPTQVPLFAIGGPRPSPLPITAPLPQYGMGNGTTADSRATFVIGENEDIVAALDPLAIRSDDSIAGTALTDRAGQMEVLYKEASFVEPSRCDEMVKRCDGDIETALKELKMDWLVDTGIAQDKGRAWAALDTTSWDLNRAAESLLG